ncbi:MAG: asparagine synthase-related protein [Nitrososphaeraceae archaeon]|nr:asparagine synthase-related protein [Nitrososphaeraceae archaeon]
MYSLLNKIIKGYSAEGLLLSGGLDSSIIASIQKPKYAFTVNLENFGSDIKYSEEVADRFCSHHIKVKVKYQDLIRIEQKIIESFETFDPIFIRNSSVIYAGIHSAAGLGVSSLLTGDGGDELFAGYNYLKRYHNDLEKLDLELKRLWEIMHFPSQTIGSYFKIKVNSPYLDSEFLEFAKSMNVNLKIGKYHNKLWGKFPLRLCFSNVEKMEKHAWREKEAQEEGSGFNRIEEYFNQNIDNNELISKTKKIEQEGVKIRNKEHLFYYIRFRKHYPVPNILNPNFNLRCPDCHGPFTWSGKFCRLCGAFPVTPQNNK